MFVVRDLRVWPVRIGYCDDPKDYVKLCKAESLELLDPVMIGAGHDACFHSWTGARFGLVVLNPETMVRPWPTIAAHIAHECTHALDWLYSVTNESGRGGCESSAYTMSFLVEMCCEAYEKSMQERGLRVRSNKWQKA